MSIQLNHESAEYNTQSIESKIIYIAPSLITLDLQSTENSNGTTGDDGDGGWVS